MTVCHHFRVSFYQPELNIDPVDRLKHFVCSRSVSPPGCSNGNSHIHHPKDLLTYKSGFRDVCVQTVANDHSWSRLMFWSHEWKRPASAMCGFMRIKFCKVVCGHHYTSGVWWRVTERLWSEALSPRWRDRSDACQPSYHHLTHCSASCVCPQSTVQGESSISS